MGKWMKQGLWMFLCGIVVCFGFSLKVQAAAPKAVYVNGIDIISTSTAISGVSYDAAANTLTLDSAEVIIGNMQNTGIQANGDLNIKLQGNSKITGKTSGEIGMKITGNLNISGNGSLIISDCGYCGALIVGGFDIQESTITVSSISGIEAASVNLNSGKLSVNATTGNAITAANGMSVSGGSLTASSAERNTIQIDNGDFLLTGGTVEINPANGVQPIYAYGAIYIYGGSIKLAGNMSRQITLKNGQKTSLGTGYWFSPDTTYELNIIGGNGSGKYKAGETVTISAEQETNSKKFLYWTIESGVTGIHVANAEKRETTFVMPARNVTITAEYILALEKNTYINTGKESYKVINGTFDNPTVAYWGHYQTKQKSLNIPNTFTWDSVTYKVISVSENAFKNNKSLTTLKIGDNVTTIGKSAFENCKALKKVIFGKNVTKIDSKAFSKCVKLNKITFKGTKLKTVKSKAFKNIKKNAVIEVPVKKYKVYKKMLKKSSVGMPKSAKIRK